MLEKYRITFEEPPIGGIFLPTEPLPTDPWQVYGRAYDQKPALYNNLTVHHAWQLSLDYQADPAAFKVMERVVTLVDEPLHELEQSLARHARAGADYAQEQEGYAAAGRAADAYLRDSIRGHVSYPASITASTRAAGTVAHKAKIHLSEVRDEVSMHGLALSKKMARLLIQKLDDKVQQVRILGHDYTFRDGFMAHSGKTHIIIYGDNTELVAQKLQKTQGLTKKDAESYKFRLADPIRWQKLVHDVRLTQNL